LPYCFLFFPISLTLVFKNKNWWFGFSLNLLNKPIHIEMTFI
jgi:hypothetical protein